METSERIKEIRKEKGLTQKQLAEKAELSIATIQGYEQGKYKPKIGTLQKIAIALDIPVTYLCVGIIPDYDEVKKKVASWGISGALPQTKEEQLILEKCRKLNETGQQKAVEQMELLTKIPEYRKGTPD